MVGFVLRRRAELFVITILVIVFLQLKRWFTPTPAAPIPGHPAPTPDPIITPAGWALIIMATTLIVALAVPASRRYVWGRCRSVVIRHRMRTCFLQTRTWTTNGRLPFLLWSRPSRVGERVRVWLPAGLSVKHLERIQDELAAACWAHEIRIIIVRSQAALVLVDVIRHDPLGSKRAITPPVADLDDTGNTDNTGDTGESWLPDLDSWPAPRVPDADTALPPPAAPPNPALDPSPSTSTARTRKTSTSTSTSSDGAGADEPGVTGFGGVDVTDYL